MASPCSLHLMQPQTHANRHLVTAMVQPTALGIVAQRTVHPSSGSSGSSSSGSSSGSSGSSSTSSTSSSEQHPTDLLCRNGHVQVVIMDLPTPETSPCCLDHRRCFVLSVLGASPLLGCCSGLSSAEVWRHAHVGGVGHLTAECFCGRPPWWESPSQANAWLARSVRRPPRWARTAARGGGSCGEPRLVPTAGWPRTCKKQAAAAARGRPRLLSFTPQKVQNHIVKGQDFLAPDLLMIRAGASPPPRSL